MNLIKKLYYKFVSEIPQEKALLKKLSRSIVKNHSKLLVLEKQLTEAEFLRTVRLLRHQNPTATDIELLNKALNKVI